MSVGCAWALCVGRWLAAAVKNHKATFPFLYFSVTKSTKSHLRGLSSLLKNTLRVHELVARSSAWQVRATKDKVKIGSFTAPHDFSHTTRANISHEKAEQIRARIVYTPAEKDWRARVKSVRRRDKAISVIDTSSVSLRLPPSAPVSATPTAFASQIGQFPTGEGLQNPSAKFHAHFRNSTFGESCQRQECAILF